MRAWVVGLVAALSLTGAGLLAAPAPAAPAAAPPAASPVPHFDHVVVTYMENEDAASTFEDAAAAPSLAALRKLGSYMPNYYGVGHNSLDNYLALFGGQEPNTNTEADCMGHTVGSCTYPATVPTLATTLTAAKDTWKIYSEGMDGVPLFGGNCLHQTDADGLDVYQGPGSNGYATRHNPAMWFDSVIDDAASCDAHSVDYTRLATDEKSAATLPTFSFVEPDTCHDGHDDQPVVGCTGDPEDKPGSPPAPSGVAALDDWLGNGATGGTGFVSTLLASPAWQRGSNLLVITFDEAVATGTGSDATGCSPGQDGSAGGRVGALLIGTGVKKGFVSAYQGDHYGLLRTIEDSEGLPTLTSMAANATAASTVKDGSATPITDVFETPATTTTASPTTTATAAGASSPSPSATVEATTATTGSSSGALAFTGLRAVVPLTALVLVAAGGATAALRRRR